MKIERPEDLRPGDKWLGMEFRRYSPETERCQFDVVAEEAGYYISCDTIQILIDAGNDEVEREPEVVEFRCYVRDTKSETGTIHAHCLEHLHDELVHVIVSKEKRTSFSGTVVASGVCSETETGYLVDGKPRANWMSDNVRPGMTIVLLEAE